MAELKEQTAAEPADKIDLTKAKEEAKVAEDKQPSSEVHPQEETAAKVEPEPESVFGEFLRTENLYSVVFVVLVVLIALCILTAFLLEPEM